uniref:hypothetical protein n=1 Tax=Klebsiella pneumoniae TaxID=573 RepID=UPI0015EE9351|nr:hypothetical protein [Klebsiella pneumoniae]
MGSCAAPSAKGDDKFITTDYLQQCRSPDPHRGSRCGGRRHGDGVRHSESHRGLLLR